MIQYTKVDTDLCDSTGARYEYAEVDENGTVQAFKRADGDFDIPLDLDKETIADLALIAHNRNITLNELMVEAISAEADRIIKENENTAA